MADVASSPVGTPPLAPKHADADKGANGDTSPRPLGGKKSKKKRRKSSPSKKRNKGLDGVPPVDITADPEWFARTLAHFEASGIHSRCFQSLLAEEPQDLKETAFHDAFLNGLQRAQSHCQRAAMLSFQQHIVKTMLEARTFLESLPTFLADRCWETIDKNMATLACHAEEVIGLAARVFSGRLTAPTQTLKASVAGFRAVLAGAVNTVLVFLENAVSDLDDQDFVDCLSLASTTARICLDQKDGIRLDKPFYLGDFLLSVAAARAKMVTSTATLQPQLAMATEGGLLQQLMSSKFSFQHTCLSEPWQRELHLALTGVDTGYKRASSGHRGSFSRASLATTMAGTSIAGMSFVEDTRASKLMHSDSGENNPMSSSNNNLHPGPENSFGLIDPLDPNIPVAAVAHLPASDPRRRVMRHYLAVYSLNYTTNAGILRATHLVLNSRPDSYKPAPVLSGHWVEDNDIISVQQICHSLRTPISSRVAYRSISICAAELPWSRNFRRMLKAMAIEKMFFEESAASAGRPYTTPTTTAALDALSVVKNVAQSTPVATQQADILGALIKITLLEWLAWAEGLQNRFPATGTIQMVCILHSDAHKIIDWLQAAGYDPDLSDLLEPGFDRHSSFLPIRDRLRHLVGSIVDKLGEEVARHSQPIWAVIPKRFYLLPTLRTDTRASDHVSQLLTQLYLPSWRSLERLHMESKFELFLVIVNSSLRVLEETILSRKMRMSVEGASALDADLQAIRRWIRGFVAPALVDQDCANRLMSAHSIERLSVIALKLGATTQQRDDILGSGDPDADALLQDSNLQLELGEVQLADAKRWTKLRVS